jgi:hypothetical protein
MLYQKFHLSALAGFAIVSHWRPFLLFLVASGALADRFDPRRIVPSPRDLTFPAMSC